MPNLLNYLKAAKDLSFGDLPLNDLDRICINELAYIPFGELAGWTTSDSQTLFDFLEENVKFVGITLLITALFLFLIRNIKGKKLESDT